MGRFGRITPAAAMPAARPALFLTAPGQKFEKTETYTHARYTNGEF